MSSSGLAVVMAKFITCNHCKAESRLEDILQEREVRPKLLEVGLQCTCGIWTHSYFTSESLKAQAVKNVELLAEYQTNRAVKRWERYKTARDVYSDRFAAFNHRWRRKFGMLK